MNYLVFTYGTLMKGRERAHVMDECEFVGDGILEDYALKELGTFPGAVYKKGSRVYGELYNVDEDKKKELDLIEGEGWLYAFKETEILCDSRYVKAYFYEFMQDKDSYPYSTKKGKWNLG